MKGRRIKNEDCILPVPALGCCVSFSKMQTSAQLVRIQIPVFLSYIWSTEADTETIVGFGIWECPAVFWIIFIIIINWTWFYTSPLNLVFNVQRASLCPFGIFFFRITILDCQLFHLLIENWCYHLITNLFNW